MNLNKKILEYFTFPEKHPTEKQIYDDLKIKIPELSKEDFSQRLKALENDHKVKAITDARNQKRYHTRIDKHFHFICEMCGKVKDVNLETGATEMIKDHVNTKVHSFGRIQKINMSFVGKCHECKKNHKINN
ncbi:MAG TPA: transcriptional repressor [Patescibacteria group bacterium]|nr:transcriptional repressor [Patescibacteria group bacterium]